MNEIQVGYMYVCIYRHAGSPINNHAMIITSLGRDNTYIYINFHLPLFLGGGASQDVYILIHMYTTYVFVFP